jgi:Reprolysin (M12B) family zinc metalloprotease/Domain of unknown function DUF11
MCNWRVVPRVVIACVAVWSAFAQAGDFRILYAEPVDIRLEASQRAAGEKSARGAHLSFDAYGRRFEIALEPNERLLSRLTPERRAALATYEVYRGTLDGLPGTWVRLTRRGEMLAGAIWDGQDLYALAPFVSTARFLVAPPAPAPRTVVYRASDIHGVNGAQRYDAGPLVAKETALDAYKTVVTELRAQAAAGATGTLLQIEVAMLADPEIAGIFGDTVGEMVARMNIVDGIFTEQVCVTVLPTDFEIFAGASNPFTSTNSGTLLDQVAQYRARTPVIRDRGLAHLMTGKDLDDDILGVAYLGVLCEPQIGVSLSEGWHDVLTSALVAAHELGHNFGAPHDGEEGPCAATARTYLMSPFLNYSDRFSDCSLSEMQPVIDSAACLTVAPRSDVEVRISAPTLLASAGEPFDYVFDVVSIGNATVGAVSATIRPGELTVQEAAVDGGACAITSEVQCDLGDMPAGDTRRVALRLLGSQSGTYPTSVQVAAADDQDTGNNSGSIDVLLDAPHDVAVSIVESNAEGYTREPYTFHVVIDSVGTQGVDDVVLEVGLGGLNAARASVDGIECRLDLQPIQCPIGAMGSGTSHTATVVVAGSRAQTYGFSAHVAASNDGSDLNNHVHTTLTLASAVDVGIDIESVPAETQAGTPVDIVLDVTSVGVRAAEGAVASLSVPAAASVVIIDAAGGQCIERYAATYDCTYQSIEPGSARRISARTTFTTAGHYNVFAEATAPLDDNRGNGSRAQTLNVLPAIDARPIRPYDSRLIEGRQAGISVTIRNDGLTATGELALDVTLPAEIHAVSASFGSGDCSIQATVIHCALASLAAEGEERLVFEVGSDTPGRYEAMVTVSTAADSRPENDVATWTIDIIPYVDAGIAAVPAQLSAPLDTPFEVPIRITTDRRPVDDVVLAVQNNNFDVVDATSSIGECVIGSQTLCSFGNLPAFTAVDVLLHLKSSHLGPDTFAVWIGSGGGIDPDNDRATIAVLVGNIGDVMVTFGAPRVDATAGRNFDLPTITVHGVKTADQVVLTVSNLGDLQIVSATMADVSCAVASTVTCDLGTVFANSTRALDLVVRADRAMEVLTQAVAYAEYDENPGDNGGQIVVSVKDAPPSNSGSSSGGGGGGGSLDWLTLCAGVLLIAWRSRPRMQLRATVAVAHSRCSANRPLPPPLIAANGIWPSL